MALSNFRKETSERSDPHNWAKAMLARLTDFFFEAIEGCSQSNANVVTHLMERARVTVDDRPKSAPQEVLQALVELEAPDALDRKIRFARHFNLPLSYVLYSNEREKVYLLEIPSLIDIKHVRTFNSFKAFADWLASIKGWVSTKPYRESADLPYFDQELRKYGTAWPTNIDCFFTDEQHKPLGMIEFQNARDTGVMQHCNNDHFLCKNVRQVQGASGVQLKYSDDIRRWTSQEILRVQSGLRLFIVTWAQHEPGFVLKELEKVTMPYFPEQKGKPKWQEADAYKARLHSYVKQNKPVSIEQDICVNYSTVSFSFCDGKMNKTIHQPPLNPLNKTFPSLYYYFKKKVTNDRQQLPALLSALCSNQA
ncbi:hypothetical protein [Pontibacter mangrovi]|uniref:Uncharacterized protein n=1 Tax=Pontibacter mangrovi TaxID=2589816 RepID=A0A501W5A2_9BACT|nr:hypothetical protein [Pontibacter mangrovi]TPE43274.1 hypothetical protein FJM65_14275 [Pontibacter mangrovi]